MSVIFNCPPDGPPPPSDSECGISKEYSWTSNITGNLYYYVPGTNESLISLTFTPSINNGSNIIVDLIYYVGNTETFVETWNLGTLPSTVTKYHFLNFASQLDETDKFIKLRITTTNGSSGKILTSLNCSIEVTTELFCTGNTLNVQTNECSCDSVNNVRIYTAKQDSLNYSFPYFKTTWYLDPELSKRAPCGNYMTVGSKSQVVYTYDCGINHNTYINYTCGECRQISCTSGSYTTTHNGYTKNNPYIDGTPQITLNGLVYSIKCFNLTLSASKSNVYVPLTFTYTGPADDVCFTISDPSAEEGSVGVLSYSEFSPSNSPFFIPSTIQTLIRFAKGQTSKTIWVIPPLSKVLQIRMAVGQDLNNVKRVVTTTTTYQCGTAFYSYLTTGLHAYSAYDSINTPKLKTYLYSFVPISRWTVGTILFCDRLLSQPAYPYYYGINNLIYKVGDPFLRELGVKKEYIVTKKIGQKAKVTERTIQRNWMETLASGEKTSPACITPLITMGVISKVIPKLTARKPKTYLYFMGYSPLEQNGGNIVASNNNTFTIWDGDKQIPVTGFQHASYKLDDSWRQGFAVYLARFGQDVQFTYKNISSLIKIYDATLAVNVGLGALSASLFYYGFLTQAAVNAQATAFSFWGTAGLNCPGAVQFLTTLAKFLGVSSGGLGLIFIGILIALLAIFVKFRKTIRESCKLYYIRYNQGPYMNLGDPIWVTTNKTDSSSGYYCDGGYFYTYDSTTKSVQKKEVSYSVVNGVKTISMKPDDPTLVVDISRLMFLPYVSGRPETY